MKAIILRGSSGSGKSTFVKQNFPEAVVCSADHYFIRNGVYVFDQAKVGQAHQECLHSFIDSLRSKELKTVVCDNTNMTVWEIAPYIRVAQAYGAEVEIHHFRASSAQSAASRNLHGCDMEIIRRQLGNFQPLPRPLKRDVHCFEHVT